MESRVVPGWSNAISLSSPSSALISVDFPTLGRPTTATRMRLLALGSSVVSLGRLRKPVERGLHQRFDALAVRGRNQPRLAQSEFVKLRSGLLGEPFGFVDGQYDRSAGDAQPLGNALVLAGQSFARVQNENHDIAFGNRLLGLRCHFPHDALGIDGLEAAGIDGNVITRADAAFTVMPVAGEPGKIGDQCSARARQPIEQCRLADIRTADDRNYGFHNEQSPARSAGFLFDRYKRDRAVTSLHDGSAAERARRGDNFCA